MRQIDDLDVFMSPGRELRLRADVLRDGIRVSDDVAPGGFTADSMTVSWDLDGEVKQIADVDITYSDTYGRSLIPTEFQSLLGPWGNELDLTLEAHLGDRIAAVPVGQLMITAVPEATDGSGKYWLMGREIVTGSVLTVRAKSQDERVRRRGFAEHKLQPINTSAWDELGRLTGLPLARNVSDVSCPKLEYERAQGNRLVQAQALSAALGGIGVVDAYGVWTIVPDLIGTPVGVIDATVIDAPFAIDSENVYNEVIGNFEDADRNPIVVPPARITSGPLAVNGPYGTYSRFYASEFVTTKAAAQAALAKILRQVSQPTFERRFTAQLDPRVEIGDTWTLRTSDTETTGLIVALEWKGDVMVGTLRFQESINA